MYSLKQEWAFDIETLINCFTVTFVDVNRPESVSQFVIHSQGLRNDANKLVDFLRFTCYDTFIGYNSVSFDMPILKEVYYLCLVDKIDPKAIVDTAYRKAQEMISSENPERLYTGICGQQHLDLFRIYHFDNEAKRTSLKWIQCHLNMSNVQDMPHNHDTPVNTMDEIKMILKYNLNDVQATAALYLQPKTKNLIELRDWAIQKYRLGIDRNTSNSHMGEMIFLSKLGDIPPPDMSDRVIRIEDLILPQIKFTTKPFQQALETFKSMVFNSEEERPKMSFNKVFGGVKYSFGLGGLHAAMEESIISDVTSIDVKSFYPNLAISFGFYPKHVGPKFVDIYAELYADRMKSTSDVANLGIKEALNSVFGKSNSRFSSLYYPEFTYSITINGQLLMAMLAERIVTEDVGTVVMVNTDGMEVVVTDNDRFEIILEEWKKVTRMAISKSTYNKLCIRDVNNYFGITSGGKVKAKGAYEMNKEFHKDPSAKILTIAIWEYYVNGTSIRDTIKNHDNINDFFLFKRAKTGKFIGVPSNASEEFDLPKTLRYLITNEGFILYQVTDSMKSKVHSNAYITIMNNLDVIEDIPIDREWYIFEAHKLLITESLTLF